jgi:6-phosphogluconolactonase
MTFSQVVEIAQDPQALAQIAAETFASLASEAVRDHRMFRAALSGGNTPRLLYERLAEPPFLDSVDWAHCQVFFSDERFVPPDSPDSNFHMAHETLLSCVPIPKEFVYPVPTLKVDPGEAASRYESTIDSIVATSDGSIPRFDLILLGLGPDGHTASLFPGTEALKVRNRLVVANYVPAVNSWRITFTYSLINAAAAVVFLVEGQEKAHRVAQTLERSEHLPAVDVHPGNGRLIWLLDVAAASEFRSDTSSA